MRRCRLAVEMIFGTESCGLQYPRALRGGTSVIDTILWSSSRNGWAGPETPGIAYPQITNRTKSLMPQMGAWHTILYTESARVHVRVQDIIRTLGGERPWPRPSGGCASEGSEAAGLRLRRP